MRENNPIYNYVKKNKINIAKEMKDLYFEKHKTLMKETKDTINGKIFHAQ